jgi:deazaflavin-dependent oxidoreductase (nitroreductase family)
MSLLGKLTTSSARFLNKRGVYAGPRSTKIHVALYRRTGGKIGGALPGLPRTRIALVDHIGAKSGTKRTSPLIYHQYCDAIVVVSSKGGQPTHPAWFHNLVANPDTTVQIDSEISEVRARPATDAERQRLWPRLVADYPEYEFYRRIAKGRRIPVMVLEPRGAKPWGDSDV